MGAKTGAKNAAVNKKPLILTIVAVALVQMPHLALTPAIDRIATEVFPAHSLASVQEAFALSNVLLPLTGVLSAFLIGRGLLSKRTAVLSGLMMLGLTAICAMLFHTEFWHIRLLSILLGVSVGLFLVNMASVMYDSFTDKEREPIAGYQAAGVNGGGILLSLLGGALGAMAWYGGYIVLFLGFPVAVLAYFTVPKRPRIKRSTVKSERRKLPPDVFYYSAVLFFFMLLYSACGTNISTHLTQAGASNPALAGVAVAVQMGGGVIAGLFFGRLSAKLGDWIMTVSCALLLAGLLLLGLFPSSVPVVFIAAFIAGTSLSLTAPRVIFAVSRYTDETNSSLASSISQSVAPSAGGFLTPYAITRVTLALFGESTAARYLFTAAIVAVLGALLIVITLKRRRKSAA